MGVGVGVKLGVLVGVGVGVAVGVLVAVGVGVMQYPPAQDAPNTTAQPPHVPLTGAAQKSAHWQQSPAPAVGGGVFVGLGVIGVLVGVAVAVAVEAMQSAPPVHDAPNTTTHPPHEPAAGAAQKSAHWQQSLAAGVFVGVGVTVGVDVGVLGTQRSPLSQLVPKIGTQPPPHEPLIGAAQLAGH